MAQIFISYAREDFKQVSELRQRLKDEGFTTWMDKVDLLAGQRWRPAIEQAVRESDFFVLCLSNRTVSKRSFVQREIKMALDLWQEMLTDDIFLIPVLLEHIEPEEIPVSIREIGWVFLFEEDGWDDLMRALKHGIKQRAIEARDERKKEEDAVRQAAAEAARIERDAAEQRLRQETARLQKEKAEIERKLQEETARRQQEETARLKKEREAEELQRQAEEARLRAAAETQRIQEETARRQKEEAERRQPEDAEQKQKAEAARQQKEKEDAARKLRAEAERKEKEDAEREARKRELAEQHPRQEETRKRNQPPSGKSRKRLAILAGAVLLAALLGYWLWKASRSNYSSPGDGQSQLAAEPAALPADSPARPTQPAPQNQREVLSYSLEIQGEKTRATSLNLASGKNWKLHFTPQTGGYLYLLAPNESGKLQTYLTAQPIKVGVEFSFPGGDDWIIPEKNSKQVPITVIFSAQPVTGLSFLAKETGRTLTTDQREALTLFRKSAMAASLTDSARGNSPSVTVAAAGNGQPVVFDIVFQRLRGGR